MFVNAFSTNVLLISTAMTSGSLCAYESNPYLSLALQTAHGLEVRELFWQRSSANRAHGRSPNHHPTQAKLPWRQALITQACSNSVFDHGGRIVQHVSQPRHTQMQCALAWCLLAPDLWSLLNNAASLTPTGRTTI